MTLTSRNSLSAVIAAILVTVAFGAAHSKPVGAALERPSVQTPHASRSVLQGAARAGEGVVAVGERGIVILSADGGKAWRQVPVPVSVGLTSVRFVDPDHGWIAGHGGVILATRDGGRSWNKQLDGIQAAQLLLKDAHTSGDPRLVTEAERLVAEGADKPFLDLHFFDKSRGIVVGAYNWAFTTVDGGQTWQPIARRLPNPKALHLYSVKARGDELVIAGEQGLVLRSTDRGQSFERLQTPYNGSYFAVALSGDRDIILAGLRGNVWRSSDSGANWTQIPVQVPAAITAIAIDDSGNPWLASQAGHILALRDGALVRASDQLPPVNGLVPLDDGRVLALTLAGVLPVSLPKTTGVTQ